MKPAISLQGVTFTYPGAGAPALREADIELPEGAFVLVAGSTGSGKSTLLRAMNGLVPHFSGGDFAGRVLVAGRDTRDHAPRDLADVVGFVPQDPNAAFVLDRVEDELAYAMENLGVDPSVMRRRVEETLDLLDIESRRDRSVRELSGGERQRVAIAAALTPGPRILLLDEPTSQLDPQGAEDVLAALQRLVHDLGCTVVIAEHRLERVAGFVDAAVGCIDGRVVGGEPSEVLTAIGAGPPVTRLGRLLRWEPVPLTVRDARRRAADVGLSPPAPVFPTNGGEVRERLVEATSVTASYGERVAVRGVDVTLRAGEVVALIGRNGAGKTTLLRCLAGLHAPASGTVTVDGRSPRPGRDVALCPQAPEAVLFSERADEEVSVTLRASHGDENATAWLDRFGIAELAARHPRDVSSGQRLLIATAAIAATGARVLLLDEPTRGLDAEAKQRLGGFLEGWAHEGRAAMIATHDVELVARIADRVVVMAAGEIVADGSPADVLSDSPVFSPQMARVFGPGWLTPEQVAAAVTP